MRPIVMISSWPPRLCGIATFAEEALEFICKADPARPAYVISHTDGEGEFVKPVIDMSREDWYVPVVETVKELDPEVIHIEHEYGLYNYINDKGEGDGNRGFLKMLDLLSGYPTVVEPHTIHGRMRDQEEIFVKELAEKCSVLLFKCHYQKWRLRWSFEGRDWKVPENIMIIPHGARPDFRWAISEVDNLKRELGLGEYAGKHIIGLVGWIQSNKRWDILTSMWEDIYHEIREETGEEWFLFAAGSMRDPNHKSDYEKYVSEIKLLESEGMARYFEFVPRGELYYKAMAVCDFIVLPSLDETQSGTLARIIALNKPYISTAPMEGLTAQTVESEGGLLFTHKAGLREKVIRLATDEGLRMRLGENLKKYLDETVSWEVVARQYLEAYQLASREVREGKPVYIRPEF
ncbi:MAG: glycosyltransferase [Planctomycetota bacterium]|nr:MAG: glycosyltransferase [Planctomycetota bacterium]